MALLPDSLPSRADEGASSGRYPARRPGPRAGCFDTGKVLPGIITEKSSNGGGVQMADVQLKDVYPVPEKLKKSAWVAGRAAYDKLWKRSIEDPNGFWAEVAERVCRVVQEVGQGRWTTTSTSARGPSMSSIFEGGKLNVSYNCLDRHLKTRGDKVAIQWEGNEPGEDKAITYKQLHEEVCKFANVLKKHGVKKGDRVCIYLPMIPELAIAMLACTRIGAIHSVVFGGFSADALRDRIQDCDREDPRHLRRHLPRRQGRSPEDQRRRRPCRDCPSDREGASWSSASATRSRSTWSRAATSGGTTRWPRPSPTASPSGWTPRIPSSSSTPPAPPASPRASCTPRPATSLYARLHPQDDLRLP
ncbi:MAG: AMP-binding protein [Desulfobacterales bacterium]|nr:AMP-binding protein [Desulfobacterales bacterium]